MLYLTGIPQKEKGIGNAIECLTTRCRNKFLEQILARTGLTCCRIPQKITPTHGFLNHWHFRGRGLQWLLQVRRHSPGASGVLQPEMALARSPRSLLQGAGET